MRRAALNINNNRRLARIVGASSDAHTLNSREAKQFRSVQRVDGLGLG